MGHGGLGAAHGGGWSTCPHTVVSIRDLPSAGATDQESPSAMLLCWKRLQGRGRLPPASCHCMSRLVSRPGPGTCGACHVWSYGSLCSEKKKFPGLQTGENT